MPKIKHSIFFRVIVWFVCLTFSASLAIPPTYAQGVSDAGLGLPVPGTMVSVSPGFNPAVLKGIKIHPDQPLRFDFIVDTGDTGLGSEELQKESGKLIKYFLASLTVPEKDMWVNLSPYEKSRIIPEKFSATEMGRDLLAQDYLLKQLTASLIYPEGDLGKEFWGKVRQKAKELYGATDIPLNTFNKVWVVPEDAVVYENGNIAFVVEARLKVMLEEDYVALFHNEGTHDTGHKTQGRKGVRESRGVQENNAAPLANREQRGEQGVSASHTNELQTTLLKELILPEIEREVNEGKNFASLRQVYHSLILATWFKRNLKKSFLGEIYVQKNKIVGVDIKDKKVREKIYEQYMDAFKQGVYNYVKEDYDPATRQMIPKKYFSGGLIFHGYYGDVARKMVVTRALPALAAGSQTAVMVSAGLEGIGPDAALLEEFFVNQDDNAMTAEDTLRDAELKKTYRTAVVLDEFLAVDQELTLDRLQPGKEILLVDDADRSDIEELMTAEGMDRASLEKDTIAGIKVIFLGNGWGEPSRFTPAEQGVFENLFGQQPILLDLKEKTVYVSRSANDLAHLVAKGVFVLKKWQRFAQKLLENGLLPEEGFDQWIETHPAQVRDLGRIFNGESAAFRELVSQKQHPQSPEEDPSAQAVIEDDHSHPVQEAFDDYERHYQADTVRMVRALELGQVYDFDLNSRVTQLRFWQKIEELESDYGRVINSYLGASRNEGRFGAERAAELADLLDYAFQELSGYITELRDKKHVNDETLEILRVYLSEVEVMHERNKEWLAVHSDLRWPNVKMEGNATYMGVRDLAEATWARWAGLGSDAEGYSKLLQGSVRLRDDRNGLKKDSVERIRANRELEDLTENTLIKILNQARFRLRHHLKTVVYSQIIEGALKGAAAADAPTAGSMDLLQEAFGADDNTGIREKVEYWVYGYYPTGKDMSQEAAVKYQKVIALTQDLPMTEEQEDFVHDLVEHVVTSGVPVEMALEKVSQSRAYRMREKEKARKIKEAKEEEKSSRVTLSRVVAAVTVIAAIVTVGGFLMLKDKAPLVEQDRAPPGVDSGVGADAGQPLSEGVMLGDSSGENGLREEGSPVDKGIDIDALMDLDALELVALQRAIEKDTPVIVEHSGKENPESEVSPEEDQYLLSRIGELEKKLDEIEKQDEQREDELENINEQNAEAFEKLKEKIGEKRRLDSKREEKRAEADIPDIWEPVTAQEPDKEKKTDLPEFPNNQRGGWGVVPGLSELGMGEDVTGEYEVSFPGFQFGEQQISQGQGIDGNIVGGWVADIQGGNGYLATGTYHKVTPTGKLVPRETNFVKKALSFEPSSEFVVVPSQGKSEFLVGIPPGYTIVGLNAEKQGVKLFGVFYDENNQLWYVTFDRSPGKIKIDVRPAGQGETSSMPPFQLVDDQGNPFDQAATDKIFENNFPAPLWTLIQKARNLSLEERQDLRDRLINSDLFYYTTNPFLRQKFDADDNLIKNLFTVFAAKCDGFSFAHAAVISHALGLDDVTIQVGYLLEGHSTYADNFHAWNQIDGRIVEATSYAGEVSPLYKRQNISRADWEGELIYIQKRAAGIRENLEKILAGIELALKKEKLTEALEKARQTREDRLKAGEARKQASFAVSDTEMPGNNIWAEIEENREYYRRLMQAVDQKVADFSDPVSYEQAVSLIEQAEKKFDFSGNFLDQYQLMGAGHQIFGVLSQLENNLRQYDDATTEQLLGRIQAIKRNLYRKLQVIAQERGWQLYEALPRSELIRTGDVVELSDVLLEIRTRQSVQELSGETAGVMDVSARAMDALTGVATLVSPDEELVDRSADVFLVRNQQSDFRLVARNYVGGVFTAGDASFTTIPLPNGDWLAIFNGALGEKILVGPAVGNLDLPGEVKDLDMILIRGEVFIRYRDLDGKVHYKGAEARRMGIEDRVFDDGGMPEELPNGKVILFAADREDHKARFYGDGAKEANLTGKIFPGKMYHEPVRIYSNGRWIKVITLEEFEENYEIVVGFAGNFNDPEIASIRYRTYPDLPVEMPNGELMAWDPDKSKFVGRGVPLGQSFRLHSVLQHTYNTLHSWNWDMASFDLLEYSKPVFWGNDFMIPVSIDDGFRTWLTSSDSLMEDVVERYGFFDASDTLQIVFVDTPQYVSATDRRWVALVKYGDDSIGYIGPLAEEAGIIGQKFSYTASPFRVESFSLAAHPTILPNGEWFAQVPSEPKTPDPTALKKSAGMVGTWAIKHGFDGGIWIVGNPNKIIGPVFARRADGEVDPDRFVLAYEIKNSVRRFVSDIMKLGSTSRQGTISWWHFAGPVASEVGFHIPQAGTPLYESALGLFGFLESGALYPRILQPIIYTLEDGNIILEYKPLGNGIPEWRSLTPPHDFFTRITSLYGIADPDAGRHIPARRIDLRWEHFNRLAQWKNPPDPTAEKSAGIFDFGELLIRTPEDGMILMTEEEKAAQKEFVALIHYMKENVSSRYFDFERVEEIIRANKGVVIRCLTDRSNVAATWELIKDFFQVLRTYHLEYLTIDILLSASEGTPDSMLRAISLALTIEEWIEVIKIYKNASYQRNDISEDLARALVDTYNLHDTARAYHLNSNLLNLLDEETWEKVIGPHLLLTERLYFAWSILERTYNLPQKAGLTAEDLQGTFAYLHKYLGDDRPFDVEFFPSARASPIGAVLRLVRSNSTTFKWGFSEDYRRDYARWQEINSRLNEILGDDFDGGGDMDVLIDSLVDEIGHDALALFVLLTVFSLVYSVRLDARFKQDNLRQNARQAMAEMMRKNPWFAEAVARGHGGEIGILDLIEQVSFGERITDEQAERLAEYYSDLDEREKLIMDIVLAIAGEPARMDSSDAVGMIKSLLFRLIPLLRDQHFFSRQNMNKRLERFATGIESETSLEKVSVGLGEILWDYRTKTGAQKDSMPEFDAFRDRVKVVAKNEFGKKKLFVDQRIVLAGRHDGIPSRRRGQGGEIWDIREYAKGDDPRSIDPNASARMGKTMVRVRAQDDEVLAGLVLDMRSLASGSNADEWIDEFVHSLRALYHTQRNRGQGDYKLQNLVFLMPDGSVRALSRGKERDKSFWDLLGKVLMAFEEIYKDAYAMSQGSGALKFYTPEQNKRYLTKQRAARTGGSGTTEKVQRALRTDLLKGKAPRVYYFVGLGQEKDEEERSKVAAGLSLARVKAVSFYWEGRKARFIAPARKAPDKAVSEADKAMITKQELEYDLKPIRLMTIGTMNSVSSDLLRLVARMKAKGYPVIPLKDSFVLGNNDGQEDLLGKPFYSFEIRNKNNDREMEADASGRAQSVLGQDPADAAMVNSNQATTFVESEGASEVGGINFNPEGLNLKTKSGGADIEFSMPRGLSCLDQDQDGNCDPLRRQDFENIQIDGFRPVIFQIVPITNLPVILGVLDNENNIQPSTADGQLSRR